MWDCRHALTSCCLSWFSFSSLLGPIFHVLSRNPTSPGALYSFSFHCSLFLQQLVPRPTTHSQGVSVLCHQTESSLPMDYSSKRSIPRHLNNPFRSPVLESSVTVTCSSACLSICVATLSSLSAHQKNPTRMDTKKEIPDTTQMKC